MPVIQLFWQNIFNTYIYICYVCSVSVLNSKYAGRTKCKGLHFIAGDVVVTIGWTRMRYSCCFSGPCISSNTLQRGAVGTNQITPQTIRKKQIWYEGFALISSPMINHRAGNTLVHTYIILFLNMKKNALHDFKPNQYIDKWNLIIQNDTPSTPTWQVLMGLLSSTALPAESPAPSALLSVTHVSHLYRTLQLPSTNMDK